MHNLFLVYLFMNLYVFWATMCPSSGETTVSLRHLVLVILYGWLSGMHIGQSSTQSDKYHVSHRYSCFSWWWAHSRPKHVEKRNKHTKKNCATSWLYLQDYTGMYGQQNLTVIYRSLNAIVAQSKNYPFGVNVTIRLENIKATSGSVGRVAQWV